MVGTRRGNEILRIAGYDKSKRKGYRCRSGRRPRRRRCILWRARPVLACRCPQIPVTSKRESALGWISSGRPVWMAHRVAKAGREQVSQPRKHRHRRGRRDRAASARQRRIDDRDFVDGIDVPTAHRLLRGVTGVQRRRRRRRRIHIGGPITVIKVELTQADLLQRIRTCITSADLPVVMALNQSTRYRTS